MIKFDFDTYNNYHAINDCYLRANKAANKLSKDSNMTGWFNLERLSDEKTLQEIESLAQKHQSLSNNLIVIGIGGSYLGSKAVIDALENEDNKYKVYYGGHTLNTSYDEKIWNKVKDEDVSINIISKSGNTMEIKRAYDFYLYNLKNKYPNDYQKHIIITTSNKDGFFYQEAKKEGYATLEIPNDVGGRFSVLTSCGLFPLAYYGFKIRSLFKGAKEVKMEDAVKYAALRDNNYRSGKVIENFAIYDEKLLFFSEWFKQLFAETQGKMQSGILPISTLYTRDLHSLGQYIQDGEPIIFETILFIGHDSLSEITLDSVARAHLQNGCHSTIIKLDELSLYNLGYLIYFFEISAAIGAYMLGVNPYDQPAVEVYKNEIRKNMEAL